MILGWKSTSSFMVHSRQSSESMFWLLIMLSWLFFQLWECTHVTIELGSSDFGRLNPVEGTEILHERRVSNGDWTLNNTFQLLLLSCTLLIRISKVLLLKCASNWATVFHLRFLLLFFAEHFHIFVGDLSPEIETHTLRDAFAAFGEISWVQSQLIIFVSPARLLSARFHSNM